MKAKSAHQKLQEKQPLFFSIGLVIALLLVISAFEWKQEWTTIVDLPAPEEGLYVLPLIPNTVHSLPPRPPVVKAKEEVTLAKNVEVVKEAIAEINPKDFIDDSPVDVIDLPSPTIETVEEVFMIVEEMPSFKGGLAGFYDYLRKNVKYPRKAANRGIKGTVVVSFVIDRDGSLTDFEVIKGIGFGCDEEAIRVLKNAPHWAPGKQRGQPVKVSMVLPIVFSLPD